MVPKFYPLLFDDNRVQILKGSAGSGKSRFSVQREVYFALSNPGIRILAVRKVAATLRDSVLEEFRKVISDWGMEELFTSTSNPPEINCVNGSKIIFKGLDNAEKIKSVVDIDRIFVEEVSELEELEFNQLLTRIRGDRPFPKCTTGAFNPVSETHWLKKRFFDKAEEGITTHQSTYKDNPFLTKADCEQLEAFKEISLNYWRVYACGHWGIVNDNAIFYMDVIDRNKVQEVPDLVKTIVAVDPATTSNKNSDETGIIIAGMGKDGVIYILDDYSLKADPNTWAKKVVQAYGDYDADFCLTETNQGGDMVITTLRNVCKSLPIRTVHATKGKRVRAEPVSALMSEDLIKHLNTKRLKIVEEQLCETDFQSGNSPDRADAYVYAVISLMKPRKSMMDMFVDRKKLGL